MDSRFSDSNDSASSRDLNGSNINEFQSRIMVSEYEHAVVLIMGEMYIAKRIENSGGKTQSLTSDGTVASTLLFHDEIFL